MVNEPEGPSSRTEAEAFGELARCENLVQTAAWVAKWSSRLTAAEGALVWTLDTANPLFVCVAAEGDGTRPFLRRSVPRDKGTVHALVRDKRAIAIEKKDFAADDPLLKGLPAGIQSSLVVPLEAEGQIVSFVELLFAEPLKAAPKLLALESFLRHAAAAIDQALKGEKKTVGMLQAIERLTNLYDLSKAFGSTIDLGDLNQIIVRKAVDFGVAEVTSLWLLESETADVVLAGTAVNENYEVENAPDAVGGSIVGDLLVGQKPVRDNKVSPAAPLATENAGYPVHSVLALPLVEEGRPVGALVLVNKRGRHPEFTSEDHELLLDLSRQAVRALRNARQFEAEKKVEELDALLTVSREITSTLDLDKVMTIIVNAAAPLITYDRSAIAIMQRGKVRVGAVSGKTKLDRKDPGIQRLEELLQWIYFSGSDVAVTQEENGTIVTDRPETEEKFRAHFKQTGFRSFYGVLLKDEEGKLGVLTFERKVPLVVDEGGRGVLSILVNQATVAVRNAQLYKQVPLAGFLKPLADRRQKLLEMPKARRLALGVGALVVLLLLLLVPWRIRVAGPARLLPGRRAAATAGVNGVVASVLHREGDAVRSGDVIATISDERYVSSLEEARSALAIAESELARHREAGDASAMFAAQARRDELAAKIAFESDQFARTRIRAPVDGVIVTPRVEERVGQFFEKGAELCVVADTRSVTAEVAIDEPDASLLKTGEPVALKLNTYPTRTFRGSVSRVGSYVREEGKDRFVIAEVRIDNADAVLKTGMLGTAKISDGRRSLLAAIFRKPARWFWNKFWPVLP